MSQSCRTGVILAALILTPPATVTAKDYRPTPTRVVDLTPAPDAELILPSARLTEYDDGSAEVAGQGLHDVNGPPLAVEIRVDRKKGTYTTKHIRNQGQQNTPTYAAGGDGSAVPGVPSAPSPAPRSGVSASAIMPATYWSFLRMVTVDPPQIQLAETTTYLYWGVDYQGNNWLIDYSDSCWSANPVPWVNTHWYTGACTLGAPYMTADRGFSHIANENRGAYWNADFGDDYKYTYVNHWVYQCGREDNLVWYNWSWWIQGEFYYFLSTQLYLNTERIF